MQSVAVKHTKISADSPAPAGTSVPAPAEGRAHPPSSLPADACVPAAFLMGGGDMGERMRAYDWSATALGAPDGWPQSLRTALRILLTTRHPAHIFWGQQLICLYNDAFARIVGAPHHPDLLGAQGSWAWRELWPSIGPQVEQVMSGRGAIWSEEEPLSLTRHGQRSQGFWTYSYSPIDDNDAPHGVGGVMVLCMEMTGKVLIERRHAFLLALSDGLRRLHETGVIIQAASAMLGRYLGASRVGYGEIDTASGDIEIISDWVDGSLDSLAGPHRLDAFGPGLMSELVAGNALCVHDTEQDSALSGEDREHYRRIATRSGIAVPLQKEGAVVAALYVHQGMPRQWTDEELVLVRETAERIWEAVERARAEHALLTLNASLAQRMEDAVAQSRLWGGLLDNVTSPVCALDLDYRFLAMNRAYADEFQRYTGHRPAVGEDLVTLLKNHPIHLASVRRRWRRALAGEEFMITEQVLSTRRVRHYAYTYTALRGRDGELTGALQYIQDVTDRVVDQQRLAETEDSLRQSQKMEAVGQLTGGIAHDFNNLLTGIIGSLDMMLRKHVNGQSVDVDAYANAAMAAANRAAALTHRLLAFSRRQPLEPRAVDANRMVREMQELLSRTLGESVQLRFELAADLWRTLCDPNQLENAVLNLAINGRDAMPAGGRLNIRTSNAQVDAARALQLRDIEVGEYVVISVTDTGSGMPREVVSRAFEPFFTTKPAGQGTGLGLSMIYGFTRQSGGRVHIHSQVGEGTSVHLYLPRYQGEEEPTPVRAPAPAVPTAGRMREEVVMIVEDEPLVRQLMIEALTEHGFRCVEAADGRSALGLMGDCPRVDLLITDIGLPGIDGLQLAKLARSGRGALPVLFVTGYAHTASLQEALLAPGMQMIIKPFDMQVLASRVCDILGA